MAPAGGQPVLPVGSGGPGSRQRPGDLPTVRPSAGSDEPLLPRRHAGPEQAEARVAAGGTGKATPAVSVHLYFYTPDPGRGTPSCVPLIGLEVDWMCVLLCFLPDVCGVLVSDEVLVSGCGGVDHHGLCVLSGSLPPG